MANKFLFGQKFNLFTNKKTGKKYLIPVNNAPKFQPRDRTKKPGGANKYV